MTTKSAQEQGITHAGNLKLLGGELCLDFTNTVDWRTRDQSREWLISYEDLIQWSTHAGILRGNETERLCSMGKSSPADANRAYQRTITLRELLYRIFSSIAAGRKPSVADLESLNRRRSEIFTRSLIVPSSRGFVWKWIYDEKTMDWMLWPIIRSAVDLLISPRLGRVRECSGEGCGWLFIDTSRNHSRRWCAMEDCGNRAKARRHYRRKQEMNR